MKNSNNTQVNEDTFESAILAYSKANNLRVTLAMTMAPALCSDPGHEDHYIMYADGYRFLIDNSNPGKPVILAHTEPKGTAGFDING